jgi:hypothetical protein
MGPGISGPLTFFLTSFSPHGKVVSVMELEGEIEKINAAALVCCLGCGFLLVAFGVFIGWMIWS